MFFFLYRCSLRQKVKTFFGSVLFFFFRFSFFFVNVMFHWRRIKWTICSFWMNHGQMKAIHLLKSIEGIKCTFLLIPLFVFVCFFCFLNSSLLSVALTQWNSAGWSLCLTLDQRFPNLFTTHTRIHVSTSKTSQESRLSYTHVKISDIYTADYIYFP